MHLANEMQAEYWSVSAKTGEWARGRLAGGTGCGKPRGRWPGPGTALSQLPPRGAWVTAVASRGLAGENVTAFFSRVAALAFEQSVLQALERRSGCRLQVGDGDLVRAYRPRVGAGGRLWPPIHLRHPPAPRSERPSSRH